MFVLVGIIFLLSSDRFKIQQVDISGTEYIDVVELEGVVATYLESSSFLVWKKSNIFLFDPVELSDAISQQFTFADVETSSSGQTLYLQVIERTSNLIWVVGEEYYVVDLEGIIVRKLSNTEQVELTGEGESETIISSLPIFIDKNIIPIQIGDSVLTSIEIQGVFDFHLQLQELGINYANTIFDRLAGKWVSVETEAGFDILFDPTGDIAGQAERLSAVLQNEIEEPELHDYIDLRFGDHVYFQ